MTWKKSLFVIVPLLVFACYFVQFADARERIRTKTVVGGFATTVNETHMQASSEPEKPLLQVVQSPTNTQRLISRSSVRHRPARAILSMVNSSYSTTRSKTVAASSRICGCGCNKENCNCGRDVVQPTDDVTPRPNDPPEPPEPPTPIGDDPGPAPAPRQ